LRSAKFDLFFNYKGYYFKACPAATAAGTMTTTHLGYKNYPAVRTVH